MKKTSYTCLFFLVINIFLSHSQSNSHHVVNLNINNENSHFGLSHYSENKVVITSNRLTKKGRPKTLDGNPVLTLFEGEVNDDGDIENLIALKVDTEKSSFNISNSTFSIDKNHLYITSNFESIKRNADGTKRASKLRIEVGEYVDNIGWTNFRVLPFCKPQYSYGHPTISPDGKQLFFVSTMRGKKGTIGQTDIFKVDIIDVDTYGEPINLGVTINSRKKELFPFIDADNTLYFSSNRKDGIGMLDIYKCYLLEDGSYSKPELLKAPINSESDDYGFIINNETHTGYFSSTRKGGHGSDDIYFFSVDHSTGSKNNTLPRSE